MSDKREALEALKEIRKMATKAFGKDGPGVAWGEEWGRHIATIRLALESDDDAVAARALGDALVVAEIGTLNSFQSAREALDELINWHIDVAVATGRLNRSAHLEQKAEPVAWRWEYFGMHVTTDYDRAKQMIADGVDLQPLYTTPPSSAEVEARALEEVSETLLAVRMSDALSKDNPAQMEALNSLRNAGEKLASVLNSLSRPCAADPAKRIREQSND